MTRQDAGNLATLIAELAGRTLSVEDFIARSEGLLASGQTNATAIAVALANTEWDSMGNRAVRSRLEQWLRDKTPGEPLLPSGQADACSSNDEQTRFVMPPARELQPGDVIKDRFELVAELGRGGMGQVFKALDRVRREARDPEPFIAIKVLTREFARNEFAFVALQREAKKAQSLTHENIVRIHDFDRDKAGMPFLTMELLSGQSLDAVMAQPGFSGLGLDQVLRFIRPVAEALALAHNRGIVHSDLKPSNIFVADGGQIKVIDFGIARAVKQSSQKSAQQTAFDPSMLGALSPAYASPDQFDGLDPDPRDDIYALACMAYELVTGQHPFERESSLHARARGRKPRRPNGLGSAQWEGLCHGLAFDREKRTPSVEEFMATLQRRPHVRWPVLAGAAALLAVIVGAAAWIYWPRPFDYQRMWVLIDALPCGVVEPKVGGGVVELTGYAMPAELTELGSRLRTDAHAVAVRSETVVPLAAFQCEPLRLVAPYLRAGWRKPTSLAVQPAAPVFYNESHLIVDVVPPAAASYLYLDMYSADGSVAHVLPSQWETNHRLVPGQVKRVGENEEWRVEAPFGVEFMVAIAVPEPLDFGAARDVVENTASYLPALQAALDRVAAVSPPGAIVANLAFIRTAPKP